MYLRIPYIDRIGIVYDITLILTKRETNIISMEVEEGTVFLECQTVPQDELIGFMQETEQHKRGAKNSRNLLYAIKRKG